MTSPTICHYLVHIGEEAKCSHQQNSSFRQYWKLTPICPGKEKIKVTTQIHLLVYTEKHILNKVVKQQNTEPQRWVLGSNQYFPLCNFLNK